MTPARLKLPGSGAVLPDGLQITFLTKNFPFWNTTGDGAHLEEGFPSRAQPAAQAAAAGCQDRASILPKEGVGSQGPPGSDVLQPNGL